MSARRARQRSVEKHVRDEVAAAISKGVTASKMKHAPPVSEVLAVNSVAANRPEACGSVKATSLVENVMLTFNTVSGAGVDPHIQEQPAPDIINDMVSKMSEPNTTNEWLDEDVNAKKDSGVISTLNDHIRGPFFDKCKFISIQKINKWSSDPDALCLKICKAVNVKKIYMSPSGKNGLVTSTKH